MLYYSHCELVLNEKLKTLPQKDGNVITASTCNHVYPKKYAHGFVVLCFVVVMQSFIMNSHGVFIHIHQGCFARTGQSLDCHSASEVSLMDMGKSVNV